MDLHPMLLAPVVHTLCFAQDFQLNLARLTAAATGGPLTVTVTAPTESTKSTTGDDAKSSESTTRESQAARRIQSMMRGVLIRKPQTLDDRPFQHQATHNRQRMQQPYQKQQPPPAVTVTNKTNPQPSPPPNISAIIARRHAPSPPPQPSPTNNTLSSQSSAPDLLNRSSVPHNPNISNQTKPNQKRASSPLTHIISLSQMNVPSELTVLSPDDSELERVAESSHSPSLTTHQLPIIQSLCVIAAESRLTAQRRAGGRMGPLSSLTAAQLLEEKRALKRELQLARDQHTAISGAGSGSGRPSTVDSKSKHARSRSLTPTMTKQILCEGCVGDIDWKLQYQPLLLTYKQVTSLLKAKGVSPSGGGGGSDSTNPSPTTSPILGSSKVPNNRLNPLTNSAPAGGNAIGSLFVPSGSIGTHGTAGTRGLRKIASASCIVSSTGTGGLVLTGTGANSRPQSRSSSPANLSSSTQFAQWTQQSEALLKAAQLPTFKSGSGGGGVTTASSNASNNSTAANLFSPYIARTTTGPKNKRAST